MITPERADAVPKLLISLGRRYVQHVNRSYGRTGTLWDSRYKSSLIDADAYLLSCMRYIELNPVRAGMVTDPANYRWSSYRHNGLGQADRLLSPHPLYAALAQEEAERRSVYRALFRVQLDDTAIADIRLALGQSQPLGSSRFHAEVTKVTGERREARPRGRPRKVAGEGNGGVPGIQQDLTFSERSLTDEGSP